MKITQLTVKRPVTTFMFFLAIVLLGFVSLRELSVDLLPNISYPRLSVVCQYQGVAPEEIETLITRRLEAGVSRIPGLRRVESVSKEGVSYMILEFSWGTDMDFAMLHTREKLDSVNLPEDVEDPTIIPLDPQSKPIMVLSVSGEGALLEIKEFAEELIKPRLEQMQRIHKQLDYGVPCEYHHCRTFEENDQVLQGVRPHSLVINATGLGKDRPGSPVTDAVRFPARGLVWEFNYRGELQFLHQARAQAKSRELVVEDGWCYFLHGWSQVIAEVFHLALSDELFGRLRETADALRRTG